MNPENERRCIAFEGPRLVARGSLRDVARAAKNVLDRDDSAAILVFEDRTSAPIEVDFRGTLDDVLERLPGATDRRSKATADPDDAGAPRSPGRPRLGVVGREVTLLPRHWDWLASQPGGASVTLRRLVETAKRASVGDDRRREARDAAYRFMNAMAGDEQGFEEACRALFAGNCGLFGALVVTWPPDVRAHAEELAGRSFGGA